MATHRYKVGQALNYSSGPPRNTRSDRTCKVTRLLPVDENGVPQYRIQCTSEPGERVTNENTLTLKV